MHLHIYIVQIIVQIIFHYRLLQGIEYSSLCHTVNPCCLSILYIVVLFVNPLHLAYPSPPPYPLW